MTIEKYEEKHPDFDIYDYYELDFVDPEDEYEAIQNINWVIRKYSTFHVLSIVVRSYYDGVIEW